MRPRHLYVHVPFCARRCSYCDFAVRAVRTPPTAAWLDAVTTELRQVIDAAGWARPLDLDTLYVGGGTPSLLGPGAMAALRDRLEPHVGGLDAAEWTAEANPENFDDGLANDWRDAGVTRVSLGVQTFHEPALRWMGRLHGAEGAVRAVTAGRDAGIEDIDVDLIFGLPERLGRSWADDVERTVALEPDHVSLYGLTAEPGTPLGRWVRDGRERLADDARYGEEYLLAANRFTAEGLSHYEVSNFARPGHRSRHNRAYWTGAAYLGVGPGAHSFLPPVRRWNLRDWAAYRTALEAGRSPVEDEERVEGEGARLERLWLGLRTDAGLAWRSPGERERAVVDGWREAGWAEVRDGSVRLTPHGWLLLDRLVVELDRAIDGGRLDAVSPPTTHFQRV